MRYLHLIYVCLLAIPAQAAETVWSRGELNARLADIPAPSEKSAGPESLQKRLDASPGDPVTEFLLRRDALAQSLPLSDAARQVLTRLAERPASVFAWQEEDGHARVAEVALDAAAAARWMLQQSRVYELAAVLREGEPRAKHAGSPAELVAAVRRLAIDSREDELDAVTTRLESLRKAGLETDEALAIVARRRDDAGLAMEILREGDSARLHEQLRAFHAQFPNHRRALLEIAMDREALAPHAVSLLGRHVHEAWAWQALNRALADRELGASAAATLARHANDAELALIAQRLDEDDFVASRAALALRLNGSDYAMQLLSERRGR